MYASIPHQLIRYGSATLLQEGSRVCHGTAQGRVRVDWPNMSPKQVQDMMLLMHTLPLDHVASTSSDASPMLGESSMEEKALDRANGASCGQQPLTERVISWWSQK